MRTGGAGLSQSSQSLHVSANCGPAVSIGAIGFSTIAGGLPSGTTICAAANKARLTNVAGSIDVDDAAGGGGGCVDRQPADHLGDLVGRGDAAERDVGYDLGAPAALQIFLGHLRNGEARRDTEAENILSGIAARDRSGHAHHCAFGGGIMPVLR